MADIRFDRMSTRDPVSRYDGFRISDLALVVWLLNI